MIYGLLVTLHIIVSFVLILVILLQAGKGGSLSETFGGGLSQNLFGTKASTFLTRATSASAIIFIITSLSLAILSGARSRSLMERVPIRENAMPQAQQVPAQTSTQAPTQVPTEEPQAK